MSGEPALQDQFLESRGRPLTVSGRTVVQQDVIYLLGAARLRIAFIGSRPFTDNGVRLGISRPGEIVLSDGSKAHALVIWDQEDLPRTVEHDLNSAGQQLKVNNKYRIRHRPDFVTEDHFTGNAGMIVTELGPRHRRYECSNGLGALNPGDLVFELSWEAPT